MHAKIFRNQKMLVIKILANGRILLSLRRGDANTGLNESNNPHDTLKFINEPTWVILLDFASRNLKSNCKIHYYS